MFLGLKVPLPPFKVPIEPFLALRLSLRHFFSSGSTTLPGILQMFSGTPQNGACFPASGNRGWISDVQE